MSRTEMPSTKQFDSVSEFAQYLKSAERKSHARSSTASRGKSWDDGMGYDEALRVASMGGYWESGAQLMTETMVITERFAAQENRPRMARALEGGSPCVPAYLMGHPRAMFARPKQLRTGKPVLSIGVLMGAIASSTAQQKINRGAAILTCRNQLEREGYRCELYAVHRLPQNRSDDYAKWFNCEVLIKKADERYNPAAVAFMLAHPAAHRRLMFKAMECCEHTSRITGGGYGYAGSMPMQDDSMTQDFDIFFEGLSPSTSRQCATENSAMEYITGEIDEQLGRMAVGAKQKIET